MQSDARISADTFFQIFIQSNKLQQKNTPSQSADGGAEPAQPARVPRAARLHARLALGPFEFRTRQLDEIVGSQHAHGSATAAVAAAFAAYAWTVLGAMVEHKGVRMVA